MREMREALRDLDVSRGLADAISVDWSPDTLRGVLKTELPGAEAIVVSNREPYIHELEGRKTIQSTVPASGLETALEPICSPAAEPGSPMAAGLPIGRWSMAMTRSTSPPTTRYTLRRIWFTHEKQKGYYYALPMRGSGLSAILSLRALIRAADWEQYFAVNRKVAEAVVAEASLARSCGPH